MGYCWAGEIPVDAHCSFNVRFLFRSITTAYYRNSAAVIVVYDTTNRQSFENVGMWLDEAEMNIGGANPSESVFLLVGHKADLEDRRQVLYEEGEYYAKCRSN